MHRIDSDANVANQFSAGSPGLGQPGTKISADWLNAIQEEIANLIEAFAVVLDKADNTQLAMLIGNLFARIHTWTALQRFNGGVETESIKGETELALKTAGFTRLSINNAGQMDAWNHELTNLATPTAASTASAAATKGYVDTRCGVAGYVRGSDGVVLSQIGSASVTCARSGPGAYQISIPGLTPTAIILCWTENTEYPDQIGLVPGVRQAGYFRVRIRNISTNEYEDSDFNFLIVKM